MRAVFDARHGGSGVFVRPYRRHPRRETENHGHDGRVAPRDRKTAAARNLPQFAWLGGIRKAGLEEQIMRFSMIKAIFRKELLDMSRDRRFLISVAVVPLIVFPLLISGMAKLLPRIQKQADADALTMAIAVRISTPSLREG